MWRQLWVSNPSDDSAISFHVAMSLIFQTHNITWQVSFEFSPNVFTQFSEFSDKNIIIFFKKSIQTCHLPCKRPRCHHGTSKTQVAEKNFELSPVHASVIYQFPKFAEFLIHLGKTPLFCLVNVKRKEFHSWLCKGIHTCLTETICFHGNT